MTELSIELKKALPILDKLNPKVFEKFKSLMTSNKKIVKKDIQIFDDELKVSDIDVTTINIKDITIDGYIIDETGTVKRLSDEAILFLRKVFKSSTIAINRAKTKKNHLDDIIRVVDIDLTTIDIKNIHKDGYYIGKDGSVKKISDEAILFLRKMFPSKNIAENVLRTHRTLEEKEIKVENIDLTSLDLKSINLDGYYIAKDGVINRLTDEAILFLRKIYNDDKIAFNRSCHEQKPIVNNGIKLVEDKKKHLVPSILSIIKGNELFAKKHIKEERADELDKIQSNITNVKIEDLADEKLLNVTPLEDPKELDAISESISKIKIEDLTNKTLLEKANEIRINVFNKASEIKGKISYARRPLYQKRVETEKPERTLIDGIRPEELKIEYFSDKVEAFKNKVNEKTLPIKKTIRYIKTPEFARNNSSAKPERTIINEIRPAKKPTIISNLKVYISRINNKIKLLRKPLFARKTPIIKIERNLIDGVRPVKKPSFIKKLRIKMSNRIFTLRKKFRLLRTPMFAKKYKGLIPSRTLVDGIRPVKKPNFIKKISINVSNIMNTFSKKVKLSKKPLFARNIYVKSAADLREFKTGLRPVKSMGDLNMLERIKRYLTVPSYARKAQVSFAQRTNNKKSYKLVKEPLFKSSKNAINVNMFKRRLVGIGGAVALSSSMISGITPESAANTKSYALDSIVEETTKPVKITGTVDLVDDIDENIVKGIELSFNESKTIPAQTIPEIILEEQKEEIVEEKIEEKVEEVSEPEIYVPEVAPVYKNEEYIDYVLNHTPYTEEHYLDEETTRNIIEKYSRIYNVNSDVVYNKIAELTNGFASEDYLYNKTISGITCKRKQVYANSYEELLMLAVRNIAQLPSNFNINYNQLHNCEYYVSPNNYAKEISDIAKLFNIDRCLVYAIIHTETNFVSDLFLQKNNPAGLMDNAKYCTFSSKEEGFIELCTEIRKYNAYGAYSLEEMAQIHCQGNLKWAPVVREVYYSLKSKEAEIFEDNDLVLRKTN